MRFKIVPDLTFPSPAVALVPGPVAGEYERQEFTLHFAFIDEEALVEAERDALVQGLPPSAAQKVPLRMIIRGWDDIAGADDAEVPFSAEALEAALQYPWFRLAAYKAYYGTCSGSPATGN